MKTLFVISANNNVGSGHIKRCLLLSNELKQKSFFIGFKKQNFFKVKNDLNYEIKKFDKKNISILLNYCKNLDIKRVIIDHTNVNFEVQKKLFGKYFLIIFDNQKKINFNSNVIINANPFAQNNDYQMRIKNKNFNLFLGSDYSLINVPKKTKKKKLNHIFLCFGGGDDKGVISKFLVYIKKNNLDTTQKYNVVIGPFNESYQKYSNYIEKNNLRNINLIYNPKNIYEIMQQSFFAIISPGTLFYELSFYSISMFLIFLNDKQKNLANTWQNSMLVHGSTNYKKINFKKIMKKINFLQKNKTKHSSKNFNYANNSKKIIYKLEKLQMETYEQRGR